jgi:predicted RNase H-like HicB family nuclease
MSNEQSDWLKQMNAEEEMMNYLIVIEETGEGFSAYSPDVLGCVASGRTREEVERAMREELEFHRKSVQLAGKTPPRPRISAAWVQVAV